MNKGYRIAFCIIIIAAAVYTGLFFRLDLGSRISTSVLDLVPTEQRDPELEMARTLVQSDQNRVLLIALQNTRDEPISAAQKDAFIGSLRSSGAFSDVSDIASEDSLKEAATLFFNQRGELLLPAYLSRQHLRFAQDAQQTTQQQTDQPTEPQAFSAWLAQRAVVDLDNFLDTAEALAYQQLIPADPLLLVIDTFSEWRSKGGGQLRKPSPSTLLVWAKQSASPFSAEGQQPVFNALAAAYAAASDTAATRPVAGQDQNAQATGQPEQPALQMQSAGVSHFAAANERGIRSEVAVFNIASVCAVLLVCALLLRSASVMVHTVTVLIVSLPLAWLITLLSFGAVPIIALVVGSVLVGVTIDYCLHVFLSGAPGHDGPLLRPLLLSCGTTTIAFLALMLSPLPLLRQTGMFVAIGLVATCSFALFYKRLIGAASLKVQARGDIAITRSVPWKIPAAIVLLVLAAGISRIHWNDSVDNLQYPLPELRAQDAAVRGLFGGGGESLYISMGKDYAQARQALQLFNDALPANAQMLNLALWTPTLEHYEQAGIFLNGSPQFATDFARELDKSGYPAESFAPFFEAYAQWQAQALAQGYSAQSFEALIGGLQTALPGPAGNLIGGTAEAKFFLSAGSMEGGAEATLTAGTFKLDTLYSLSGIFSRYRENALALSLYGLLVITGGCLIVYKPKRGAMVLLVPLLAGLATLGTLGYVHSALNLFHVIGMFLGVCLALDYGAFALRNRGGASVPYSVCVAAATSVSAFALLALSRIAAVTALGLTVTLCIAYAFIFVVLLTIPARSKTR